MSIINFSVRKNVLNAVFSFAVNVGVVFFGYRLLIEYGGIEVVGLWSMIGALTFFVRVGDVGMAAAITKFVAQMPCGENNKIKLCIDTGLLSGFVIYAIVSFAVLLLLYVKIDFFVHGLSERLYEQGREVLPLIFIMAVLSNLSSGIQSGLAGLHVGYISSRLNIVGGCIQLLFVFILVPKYGISGMVIAQILQVVFVGIAGWFFINKKLFVDSRRFGFSFPLFREMLSYSLSLQGLGLVNGLFEPISKIIINRFFGLDVQGIYELAYKTISLPRNAVMAGVAATFPALNGMLLNGLSQLHGFYRKTLRISIFAISAIFLLVIAASPVISYFWMGSVNFDYVFFTALLAAGFWGNCYGAPAYNIGLLGKSIKYNFISSLLSIFILVIAGWLGGELKNHYFVVAAVAGALFISGFYIKLKNELVFSA